MSMAILLDSGPLGVLSNPHVTPQTLSAKAWLFALRAAGRRVIVPEITDYETRRELLRLSKTRGLANLDLLAQQLEYLPLTTAAMRKAAELWAAARRQGRPTAAAADLDADVILAAQALTLGTPAVVATSNVRHLSALAPAADWQTVAP